MTATKTYSRAGTYTVTLTVTDDRGGTDTVSSSVVVAATAAPTADIKFSPSAPGIRETVFFTGEASRAATGRQIVSFAWQFGNGGSDTGVRVDHRYEAAGTYLVSLTVTDDLAACSPRSRSPRRIRRQVTLSSSTALRRRARTGSGPTGGTLATVRRGLAKR